MKCRILCALLAAVMLTACTARPAAPGTPAATPGAAPVSTPAPLPTPAPAPTPAPVTAWADMEYRAFDLDAFLAGTEELTALAAGDDADALCACYEELYAQYLWAYTMASLATAYNDLDVTNAVWAQRLTESSDALFTAGNALAAACRTALQGPLAAAFRAHIGTDAAAALTDYEPMTGRELELAARRSELTTEYYARMAEVEAMAAAGRAEAMAGSVGPVYRELVAVCDEQARLRGYDDFGQYVYAEEYGRDYDPADARALFAEIKTVLAETAYVPDRSPVWNLRGTVAPVYSDPDEMLQALAALTCDLDPMFGEQWQYLTANGLYDIGSGADRADLSLTVTLPSFNNGQFIIITQTGTPDDLSALVHEFGHFTALRTAPCPNYLAAVLSLDLDEIPSTALELLAMRGYDDVYDAGADAARFMTLSETWDTLVSNAMYAEFELEMFEHPDLSVAEMSLVYDRLRGEYGFGRSGAPDYGWMYVPHLFFGPGYVASYVAATLASLQVWAAAEADFDRGLDIYRRIVYAGDADRPYSAVLESAGLHSFTAPGTAAAVCETTLDALQALEQKILTAEALAPAA